MRQDAVGKQRNAYRIPLLLGQVRQQLALNLNALGQVERVVHDLERDRAVLGEEGVADVEEVDRVAVGETREDPVGLADELARDVPGDFTSLNDFFTRELADAARPIDKGRSSIVSPVDGTVSAAGDIQGRMIFQAKGRQYSLHDLLATNISDADAYVDGRFATIYLAPYNYHRVHAPLAGELVAARSVLAHLIRLEKAGSAERDGERWRSLL